MTVTSGASGSGGGLVGFSAAANDYDDAHRNVTIATRTFTVNQAGAAVHLFALSGSQSVVAGGGSGARPDGASRVLVERERNTGWPTVTSGASGTGTGFVAFAA